MKPLTSKIINSLKNKDSYDFADLEYIKEILVCKSIEDLQYYSSNLSCNSDDLVIWFIAYQFDRLDHYQLVAIHLAQHYTIETTPFARQHFHNIIRDIFGFFSESVVPILESINPPEHSEVAYNLSQNPPNTTTTEQMAGAAHDINCCIIM